MKIMSGKIQIILAIGIMKMNKQLQKQNLDELFSERKILQLQKQTLLNILSAKGIIYTYYKNKKLTKGKL